MRISFRSWLAVLLLASSVLLGFVIQLSAQNTTGTINGVVQDSGGSILVSARVTLQPSGRQVASDSQGQFRITNLAAGEYTLTASYVGFSPFTTKVQVQAGQTANVTAGLQVGSEADTVMVTGGRLQGDAEAVNVERMSAEIVQVLPATVITSLPNTNIADAVGRLPSVSLERDEGEGKYVQIRGTEPRLSNVTINGVNVPAPEVTVRNIKLDAVPSNIVERIEVYKTLAADQDADAIGGTVNLVTPTASEKPTYYLNTTTGYNPIQNGFWRGGFDATYGQRFGANKKFGFLLGGSWDKTNRGIDDLEPTPAIGKDPATKNNIVYFPTADLRSYDYYRTRYGFDNGIDYKITPTTTAYIKGLYADFHDYGDTRVYTPNTGGIASVSGNTINFDNTGSYQYRHYVRRPDQQVFSILSGVTQAFTNDMITYEFAGSRGHNIGGQDFPTTNFQGPATVMFSQNLTNTLRPTFAAQDGTSLYDATQYGVSGTSVTRYHATQLNYQGNSSLAHNYTIHQHPSTLSIGLKIRNSASTQVENDQLYGLTASSPFALSNVLSTYTNPTYYDKSYAVIGQAYGPTSNYSKIRSAFAANSGAFQLDNVGSIKKSQGAFFNADERVTAGYVQDVIFVGKLRLQGGIRFEGTNTHFLTNQVTTQATDPTADPLVVPTRQNSGYVNVLPSVQVQYQLQKDTNLRANYGRGISRPNIGDLVPTVITDPNGSPPSVSLGNPNLQPTKANNYDVLIEHYFQPLGILQAGYFYKQLSDPIFRTSTSILLPQYPNPNFQQTQSINGPSAHIQGIEMQWEQRFSFLPGLLSGIGVSANYSYTTSQLTFPNGFNTGRTDKPHLQRQAPNNYNLDLTYDKARFSSRFAVSHNDANIYAYQWGPSSGPIGDPILGLRGPNGDNYLYAHTQYDIQGSYRIYKGIQLVASGLNLSNEVFGFYNGSDKYPLQREYYRPTVSFGVRWSLAGEK